MLAAEMVFRFWMKHAVQQLHIEAQQERKNIVRRTERKAGSESIRGNNSRNEQHKDQRISDHLSFYLSFRYLFPRIRFKSSRYCRTVARAFLGSSKLRQRSFGSG